MNTKTLAIPEITFSEDEVEKITGLATYELRLHQPRGFGCPGHWFLNKQSRTVYTEKGVTALADALQEVGYAAAATVLRAKLNELKQTPSLSLFAQAAKQTAPWFRQGDMA